MEALSILEGVGITPRAPQVLLMRQIEGFLASDAETMCANAQTGIGKTLAYLAPAIQAAGNGKTVVISTHTVQQIRQIEAEGWRLGADIAVRLGRANFFSPNRIKRWLANADDRDSEAANQLRDVLDFSGTIDDFEVEYGPLLVARSDLCLTPACRDQGCYETQRVDVAGTGIVLQSHAMTIIDVIRDELSADIVIYDEGDALPAAAAGFAEYRVTDYDLKVILDRYERDGLEEAVEAFRAWAGSVLRDQDCVFKQRDSEAAQHAVALREVLAGINDDHVRDVRRSLSAFINLDPALPYRGAAVVKDRGRFGFAVVALDPAWVLCGTYGGRKSLFVSATLGFGTSDFRQFRRSVGAETFDHTHDCGVDIMTFGSMTFTLADRDIPKPFGDDGERQEGFDEYAAAVVKAARATGGRVLVLAASFEDVEQIAGRVPGIIAHRRGEKLAGHLEAFKASEDGVLVTPSAWAGVDLPGLLSHVVILRVPSAPREAARVELLRALLVSRGSGGENAESILFARHRQNAIRKLAQGHGRGIRCETDSVRMWIADPRFPLPVSLVRNPRLLLSQGPAVRNIDYTKAVPVRFADAFSAAEIFHVEEETIDAA